MLLHLDALLLLVLVVVTCGIGMSQLCQSLDRPYLLVVRGTRTRLFGARLASWGSAIAGSVAGWFVVAHLFSGLFGLVTFFGFEAIVLEFCAQRILFVPQVQAARPVLDLDFD